MCHALWSMRCSCKLCVVLGEDVRAPPRKYLIRACFPGLRVVAGQEAVVGAVVGEVEVVVAVVGVMVVMGSQRRHCRSHYDSSGAKVHSWAMVCHRVFT